jgi:hypothetical protein
MKAERSVAAGGGHENLTKPDLVASVRGNASEAERSVSRSSTEKYSADTTIHARAAPFAAVAP